MTGGLNCGFCPKLIRHTRKIRAKNQIGYHAKNSVKHNHTFGQRFPYQKNNIHILKVNKKFSNSAYDTFKIESKEGIKMQLLDNLLDSHSG